jgi:hypothetical protein
MIIRTALICNQVKILHMSDNSKKELKDQEREEIQKKSYQLELQESYIQDKKYDEPQE